MKANGWDKTDVLNTRIAGLLGSSSTGHMTKAVAEMTSPK